MKPSTTSIRRATWMLMSGACGLALVVGLLLFVRLPVRAKPAADPMGAGVTVEKYANTDFADAGDTLTYTISIGKLGADATSAWLTDELPTQLTYVADSLTAVDSFGDHIGTFGASNGVITWHAPSLAGNVWITFSAQISSETEADIVNVAEVTGTGELITDSWKTRLGGGLIYMPLIARRWPPIPYAPILHEISNPDRQRDYTVNWDYDYAEPPVFSYTLQEARNEGFTQDVTDFQITAPSSSKSFANKDGGTYYYRVRGHNTYGPGPWSNVVRTTVFYYFDDFSDYQSGWPREWTRTRGALYRVRPYEHPACPGSDCKYDGGDGYLIARRNDGEPFARFGPNVKVPGADYEITLDARWFSSNFWNTYQIFFGSDKSFEKYYAVQVRYSYEGYCAYSIVKDRDDNYLEGWSHATDIKCQAGDDASRDHWKIRRKEGKITVWVNNVALGTWTDWSYGADRYFGVGATTYEFTPSKPEFDNFRVRLID